MSPEELRAFIAANEWRFAKTMPTIPHEYTLRKHAADTGQFERAVQFIRDHGYTAKFYGRQYVYYDVDGYQYWSMPGPVADTILINRARLPESKEPARDDAQPESDPVDD